jgi:uncharacterized protein YbjT (DUF2867 family)
VSHEWPPLLSISAGCCSQLVKSGRNVVAATRSTDRAADVFSDLGIASSPHLFVRGGVDVTAASSLPGDLLSGVTQIVSALGPVFGRTAQGQMGCETAAALNFDADATEHPTQHPSPRWH